MSLNHSPSIVTDGLVLCLDAANQRSYPKSGTTWSDLKGGNNGSLTNMDATNFSSDNGGSLTFDGSNEYVDVGLQVQDKLIMSQQASVAMWVKPSSNPVDSGLLSNYDGDAASNLRNGIGLRRISDKIRFGLSDSGATNYIFRDTNSGACPINKWSHVCAMWDGSTSATGIKVYINGQRADTTSVTSGTVNSLKYSNEPMTIARVRFSAAPYLFQGRIAHASIYSRALTADEIRRNYEATVGRYT